MSRILFLTQEAAGELTSPGDPKLRGLRVDPGLKGRVGLRGRVAQSPLALQTGLRLTQWPESRESRPESHPHLCSFQENEVHEAQPLQPSWRAWLENCLT